MQPDITNPSPEIYKEISRLQIQLLDKLDNVKDESDRALKDAEAEYRRQFLIGTPPTRLGIERAAMERYSKIAYNADFDFIWPRLRMALPKDAVVTSAVDTAGAQLDFAILTTVAVTLTTAFWLPVLALWGTSYAAYFVVGLLGPAIVALFYRLTLESQRAFGEVMVTAVDTLRLQLLATLRQPLPASLSAEQKAWGQLQASLYSGLGDVIRYRHPKQ
jgi:hypothetical protein